MHKTICGALALSLSHGAAHAQTIASDTPLGPAQKREISRIVEDIASVPWEKDFQNGAPPNDELILFGIYQTALRNFKLFKSKTGSSDISLPASQVDSVARRYFGRVPRHHSLDYDEHQKIFYWTYRKGVYHGFSESFEQQGVEKVKFIRVLGAGRDLMTVRADFVDSMASATSDPEHDVVVKIQITLRRSASGRLLVWSYKRLSPRA